MILPLLLAPAFASPLADEPWQVVYGRDDYFGVWLVAGDVDGDGLVDLVTGGDVYRGDGAGFPSTPTWTLEQDYGWFGHQAVADFDGDGIDDILYGDPFYPDNLDWVDDTDNYGAVWLYLGSPDGPRLASTVLGDNDFCYLGYRVASGDVDGDGYVDALAAEGAYGCREGVVVFRGSAAGLSSEPDYAVHFDPRGRGVSSLWSPGDVDGDGFDDIAAVQEEFDDTLIGSVGCVEMFGGGASGPFGGPSWSACHQDLILQGAGTSADVNGDGFADVVVEDGVDVDVWFGGPDGLGPSGRAPDVPLWAPGESLAAGDMDGDGYPELLVGDPHGAGDDWYSQVRLLRGTSEGPRQACWGYRSDDILAKVGYGVAVADVDGDGLDDAFATDPEFHDPAPDGSYQSGLVDIWHGGDGDPDTGCPDTGPVDTDEWLALDDLGTYDPWDPRPSGRETEPAGGCGCASGAPRSPAASSALLAAAALAASGLLRAPARGSAHRRM